MDKRTSEKQLEYSRKYLSQLDDIKIRAVHGERDRFREYATSHGWKSLNECMLRLMDYAIETGLTAESLSEKRRTERKSKK